MSTGDFQNIISTDSADRADLFLSTAQRLAAPLINIEKDFKGLLDPQYSLSPSTEPWANSKAERLVFDRLKRAFGNHSGYVAYHSLNLTRHAKKCFGEIDFLICCPLGMYVLEVKGGRVSCKDGEWNFTDKNGNTTPSREGPFKQAQSALHGLRDRMKEVIPAKFTDEFCIGYCVILPDCELSVVGVYFGSP
jgi:hypothetical protein